MKIAIVVQSNTGNTRQLAEAIQSTLPDEMLIYSGAPAPEALQADLIFASPASQPRSVSHSASSSGPAAR